MTSATRVAAAQRVQAPLVLALLLPVVLPVAANRGQKSRHRM